MHPQQVLDTALEHYRAGRTDETVALLSRATDQFPNEPIFAMNLGVILRRAGRVEQAIPHLRCAAALRPDFADVHLNLGDALRATGHLDEAIVEARRAIAIRPDHAGAHNNLGNALEERGDHEGAATSFRTALALQPDNANARKGLLYALLTAGHTDEAIATARRAAHSAEERADLAMILLTLGQHEEGWREYEHRPSAIDSMPGPRWGGEFALGSALLLRAEQGAGDTIQFLRYLSLAQQRSGARVILECQPQLVRVVTQSCAELGVEVIPQGDELPAFDSHLPLMSLPFVLGLPEPVTPEQPYLRSAAREAIGASPGLRVGLVWSGNPHNEDNRRRAIGPERLRPIIDLPGMNFYSLQLGQPTPAGVVDLSPHITDFADTAALMAGLDLIITVCTAPAHLAGALGRPVWTLLHSVPDWRWGLEGDSTPWYPTMRLFRQKTAGDWDEVIQRVAGELRVLAARA